MMVVVILILLYIFSLYKSRIIIKKECTKLLKDRVIRKLMPYDNEILFVVEKYSSLIKQNKQ